MSLAELYTIFLQSTGISTDTRKLNGQEMFFALKGENFDGNEYVEDALLKGCLHVVSDDSKFIGEDQVTIVPSVLETLQDLARMHRQKTQVRILAITGSNGKTTSKELLARVLETGFNVLATKGNLNNHIGVPLTLLSIKEEEFAIIEMGANHPGEIAALCDIARPDYGLITNIGKAHLEGFGDIHGVKSAKGELYDFLARTGGLAFINREENYLEEMARARELRTFTYGRDGLIQGICKQTSPEIVGSFIQDTKEHSFRSILFGEYNYRNILSALAVGSFFKLDPEKMVQAVERYKPDNNRSQLVSGKSNTLILDAYNANPSSMLLAISEFSKRSESRKMLILGEMMELGSDSFAEHDLILKDVSGKGFDEVILVGEQFYSLARAYKTFHFFRNVDEYILSLRNACPTGYLIMLKGSRKNALEKATNLLLSC